MSQVQDMFYKVKSSHIRNNNVSKVFKENKSGLHMLFSTERI